MRINNETVSQFVSPGDELYQLEAGGSWVGSVCEAGSSHVSGRDSWIRKCAEWSDGLWQLGTCVPGNHTHVGTDRWLVDCWGLAELGGVYSFDHVQVGGGYFNWLGGAEGSWWDDSQQKRVVAEEEGSRSTGRFLLATDYDKLWWAGAECHH